MSAQYPRLNTLEILNVCITEQYREGSVTAYCWENADSSLNESLPYQSVAAPHCGSELKLYLNMHTASIEQ